MTEQKGATTILCLCRIKQFRNKDIQFLTRYLISDIIITKRYKQIDQCLKYSKIKLFRFIDTFKWVWHDIFPPPPPLLRNRFLMCHRVIEEAKTLVLCRRQTSLYSCDVKI